MVSVNSQLEIEAYEWLSRSSPSIPSSAVFGSIVWLFNVENVSIHTEKELQMADYFFF